MGYHQRPSKIVLIDPINEIIHTTYNSKQEVSDDLGMKVNNNSALMVIPRHAVVILLNTKMKQVQKILNLGPTNANILVKKIDVAIAILGLRDQITFVINVLNNILNQK